jgi:hypothetical protein
MLLRCSEESKDLLTIVPMDYGRVEIAIKMHNDSDPHVVLNRDTINQLIEFLTTGE